MTETPIGAAPPEDVAGAAPDDPADATSSDSTDAAAGASAPVWRAAHRSTEDDRRSRVLRLLQFIRELVQARSVVIRDVADQESVLWLDGAGIVADTEATPGEVSLTIAAETGPAESTREQADAGQGARESYDHVSQMLDELAERPESVELVLCSGLLTVGRDVGERADDEAENAIRTHVVSQPVVAERDPSRRIVRLRLASGSVPELRDLQLLAAYKGFGAAEIAGDAEDLARTVASPLAPAAAEFVAGLAARLPEGGDVSFTDSPALVLRRRSSGPLLDYYRAMIAALRHEHTEVPIGLAQLVEPIEAPERMARLAASGALSPAELVEDALYPLVSNAEQREILAQLGLDSGVVVEGPPGTGKTHTIANLVSALLAKGQRVLVVSEKAQALHVLHDKLPAEVAGLAVPLSDVARDGTAEIVAAVEAIADAKGAYSAKTASSEIKNLRSLRDQARAKRERILADIWRLRESETRSVDVADGYSGTPAEVVRRVVAGAQTYTWLPGPLDGERSPLGGGEYTRLIGLLQARQPSWRDRLSHSLPDLDALLPDALAVDDICERIAAAPREKMVGSGSLLSILTGIDSARLTAVRGYCDHLSQAVGEVRSYSPRLQQLAEDVLSGDASYVWSRVGELSESVEAAEALDRKLATTNVEVARTGPRERAVFTDAAEFLEAGGQWRPRFRKPAPRKAVEDLRVAVTVDGRPPEDAAAMRAVADHLAVVDVVQTARERYADLGLELDDTGSRTANIGRLVRLDQQLRWISELVYWRDTLVHELESISPGGPRPKSLDEVEEVARQAGAIAAANDGVLARAELDRAATALSAEVEKGPSAEGDALVAALRGSNPTAIQTARRAFNAARAERDSQGALDLLLLRLRNKAPALCALVEETYEDASWADRAREIDAAWAWRRADTWARDNSDPGREGALSAALDAVEADVSQLTAQLAGACAWQECLERMTVEQSQALQSYRDHLTNLGKGSGKHAERFRAAAASAMGQARTAVPAWIMPISHVVTTIAPEPGAFDVVIVDEASQADISSLFLLWLAPRVIVVGDDRQCAPPGFRGAALDEVFAALDAKLPDIPRYMRDSFTPRSNLFSLLRSRFGHVVRLREHFRSMPEIIEYSSRQFYPDAPLVPVRQFGAERLPPLRATFVPDAEVTGKAGALVNRKEADAIVDAVAAAIADPAYAGLTMGVVVLQGQRQVDLIYRRLREKISAVDWIERRIRVGTPPDFQGDERNVVFMGMVVSGDRTWVALTRSESQRRFNVATSRAMDQLWLFHSVGIEQLKPNDLRASLLGYVEKTTAAVAPPMPKDVPADERREPFDSLYEQLVFRELADRGFYVTPKVEVNHRVIDLVVTGAKGRLAVECDGDEFRTTAEQARADMERERELRRCGWRFWRVRESEYLLDRDAALDGLWQALAARGVEPNSVSDAEAAGDDGWQPIDLLRE